MDAIFDEIKEKGYLVNNLFQVNEKEWRCSLREMLSDKKEDFYEYGTGHTPEEAARLALYNAMVVKKYSRKKVIRNG